MKTHAILRTVVLAALLTAAAPTAHGADADRVQLWPENPFYWQYKGEPVLLGGSWQDNLCNHPTYLEEQLDTLVSVGGNYVRNTMCSRNVGNVRAFEQTEDALYDLDEWNDEYWERLDRFLELTAERDIIVQIEIWDPWDYFEDHQSQGGWSYQPFNPENNVTYTAEETGLPIVFDEPPTGTPSDHPFFLSIPELDDLPLVLEYQKAFMDKLLSVTFVYSHVLYCMHNETGQELEWGDSWVRYVRARAEKAGKQVETADMRCNGNFATADNQYLINNPDRYTFLEISQNNARQGQIHWTRLQQARGLTANHPRPMNSRGKCTTPLLSGSVFGDTDEAADAAEGLADAVEEQEQTVPEHRRRKPRQKRDEGLPAHLPRYETTAEATDQERVCLIHGERTLLPESMWDKTETLEFERPRLKVRVTKYLKYACENASECGITSPERLPGIVEGNK